jgi:hypothetical protein
MLRTALDARVATPDRVVAVATDIDHATALDGCDDRAEVQADAAERGLLKHGASRLSSAIAATLCAALIGIAVMSTVS